jgi:shikimate dehydrogenase
MINKDTKIYGSFSNNPGNNGCTFFNTEFEKRGINAIYKSFYSTDAELLIKSVKHLNFSGFALSMPLKIEIIQYLDEVDEAALKIGAVNTVVNRDGKLIGYNTDWIGVYNYIKNKKINFLIILGKGGFSKAVQYACKKLDILFIIMKRENWNQLKNIDAYIFNATPADVETNGYLIDGRPFTEDGKEIAKLQAIEQFKIYTGLDYE